MSSKITWHRRRYGKKVSLSTDNVSYLQVLGRKRGHFLPALVPVQVSMGERCLQLVEARPVLVEVIGSWVVRLHRLLALEVKLATVLLLRLVDHQVRA